MPENRIFVDIEKILVDIKNKFKKHDIRVSFSDPQGFVFKGDYYGIFHMFEKLILSSLSSIPENQEAPYVYISVSLLENHLCVIYRDSESISNPDALKENTDLIETGLNGEINYKVTASKKAYYDIMIPSE